MIETKVDLLATNASAAVIPKSLADSLAKSTKNVKLRDSIEQSKGETIVVTKDIIEELREFFSNAEKRMTQARENKTTSSGRPRLPEPTPEEIENFTPREKLRWQNRVWQRQSRANRGITMNP